VIEARNYVSFAELGPEIPGFTAEKDSGGGGDAVWWLAAKFGWNVYVGLQSRVSLPGAYHNLEWERLALTAAR
jgi:hypothetical protein